MGLRGKWYCSHHFRMMSSKGTRVRNTIQRVMRGSENCSPSRVKGRSLRGCGKSERRPITVEMIRRRGLDRVDFHRMQQRTVGLGVAEIND